MATIERVCAPIRTYIYSKYTGWAQYIESWVVVELGKQMVEDGLIPLLVHDAVYVPRAFHQKYDELKERVLIEVIEARKHLIRTDE